MITIDCTARPIPGRRRRTLGATVLMLALPLLGCDDALDVDVPGVITEDGLTGPGALTALYAGAIGDFNLGYAGGEGGGNFRAGIISASATLSDEVMNTGSSQDRQDLDRRQLIPQNSDATAVFRNLHRGRAALSSAAARLDEAATAAGQPDPRVGELLALEGFAYIGFAENYCSGVPISTVTEAGVLEYGTPQTGTQLLETAVARFDAALGKTGGDANVDALARVGKARAQLNLDDPTGAAATAAPVPAGFVYQIFSSPTSSTVGALSLANGFFQANNLAEDISVSDIEGANGLPFRTAADPRVPVSDGGDGIPPFLLLAYAITGTVLAQDAPTPLASATEARLIEAEAQLRAGNFAAPGTGTLAILNDLRANLVGGPIAPLVDPVTSSAREDVLFQERAFWLYATGHRLGDLRRLVRQYGRGNETVFPTGVYGDGPSTYGSDVNLPIPSTELNNPNSQGCLDRNA